MASGNGIEVDKSRKMVKCSYCTNRASRGQSNHSFPMNDPTLLKEWLKNMKLKSGWTPTVHSRLCSDHFSGDCFKTDPTSFRRTLKKGSIPTIFTENKRECAYCKATKSQGQVRRSLHKFPLYGPKTLAKWLGNMGIKDWYPTESSRLCSDHFEPSCLRLERGYIALRDGSIPSIFLPESRVETSVSQTPEEAGPVTEATELDQESLEQRTIIDKTELSAHLLSDEANVDAEIAVESSECLATCPQCNHTFNPKGPSDNLRRESSSDENCPKRPRTDEPMGQGESSQSTVGRESEPVAISSRSEFEFPDANVIRKSMLHDHHYEISPVDAKKKLESLIQSNKELRKALRIEKQRCNRMRKMITSLRES